ncbi:probable serine/threonine-protein kinase nek3 [Patella vulgata]|uniref:probable serine/threonine-protein kinase nek3 n=1 Tax=Patella vulgata TaxID=6465 RepID=UPI00217FEE0B|nr:probable serine/threonine-protein kinase nek3 [Patella vulgata]
MMAGEYEKLQVLGSGTFGTAWLANIKSSRKKCVLKEIKVSDMTKKGIDQAIIEVTVLARCRHENIIRYLGAFIDDGCLFIAMEYAESGDLSKKIDDQKGTHFKEDLILTWFVQINMALAYIHSQNILHRDLKPQNIFVTKGDVLKLGDFGIARLLNDKSDFAMTVIGTPYYLSPEICQNQPYNHKSDIWALGCILYELCCLRVPFRAADFTSQVMTILSGSFEPIPRHYGPLLEDLVSVLLRTHADSRPTAEQILSIPAIQIYVLQYTQNLQRLIMERKYQVSTPNPSEASRKIPVEKNEDIEKKRPNESPAEINNNDSDAVDNEQLKEVADKNKVQLDKNQNIIDTDANGSHNKTMADEEELKACCTPVCQKNYNTSTDTTPENCSDSATCYCVTNPKKIRLMTISPHMKDIVKKQRAAFSCEPGMKLNVGNQDPGPPPVMTLFPKPKVPQVKAQQAQKVTQTNPASMAHELMARKNLIRSKSLSGISANIRSKSIQDQNSRNRSNMKITGSVEDLRNISNDKSWKRTNNDTPVPRRRDSRERMHIISNMNINKNPLNPLSGNQNDSGCSDEVFSPGQSEGDSSQPTTRSSESSDIDSTTFRVPLDRPRLSVPDIDRRHECQLNDENNRVLYQALLQGMKSSSAALSTLNTYLQRKLGVEHFQQLYTTLQEATKTKIDYDALKLRMKKSALYLPLFVEILRMENKPVN